MRMMAGLRGYDDSVAVPIVGARCEWEEVRWDGCQWRHGANGKGACG